MGVSVSSRELGAGWEVLVDSVKEAGDVEVLECRELAVQSFGFGCRICSSHFFAFWSF